MSSKLEGEKLTEMFSQAQSETNRKPIMIQEYTEIKSSSLMLSKLGITNWTSFTTDCILTLSPYTSSFTSYLPISWKTSCRVKKQWMKHLSSHVDTE